MSEDEQEKKCVERCLKGDLDAFGVLMDRYERPVFNIILRMVGNAEDARELCQQVFMKTFEHLSSYDPNRKFFSWIYRMAMNESINHLKARRPQEALSEGLEDRGTNAGDWFESVESYGSLHEAIMELPPDYRAVVILRHFVQLSYREAADLLNVPEKLVKSRLFSARQLLRKALEAKGLVRN
jgi:RNA polymerase sigma-70 factor (ECF subfamily)